LARAYTLYGTLSTLYGRLSILLTAAAQLQRSLEKEIYLNKKTASIA
jgi:hypothetical protein